MPTMPTTPTNNNSNIPIVADAEADADRQQQQQQQQQQPHPQHRLHEQQYVSWDVTAAVNTDDGYVKKNPIY